MQLCYAALSPYARKVRVCAAELDLNRQIELLDMSPWEENELPRWNPLGKVPAMKIADGTVLFDSPVICEYLDSLGDNKLIPTGDARWAVARQHALCDGIIDAAFLVVVETLRRPEEFRWNAWIERQRAAVGRALDTLESESISLTKNDLNLGHVTAGCALGYLDFRLPDTAWREGRPNITKWYESFSQRESMASTKPV